MREQRKVEREVTLGLLKERLEDSRKIEHSLMADPADIDKARSRLEAAKFALDELRARGELIKEELGVIRGDSKGLSERINDMEFEIGKLRVKYFAEGLLN